MAIVPAPFRQHHDELRALFYRSRGYRRYTQQAWLPCDRKPAPSLRFPGFCTCPVCR